MTLGTQPYHGGAVTEPARGPENAPARNIDAHFAGPVTGQVVIGDGNVLIDRSPGAYVKVTNMPPPRPRLRQLPVKLTPRDFPELLGRKPELERASKGLTTSRMVQFHAGRGWGKSVLLRHLSCRPPGGLASDGLAFLDAGSWPLDDVIQILFDVFYETDVPFKPSPGQLRQHLAEIRALVVLDDLGLDQTQLTVLSNAVPECLLLIASEGRTLWGEGEAIALHGLPESDALALFQRELGRSLTADERPLALNLCRRVAGQPLAVLQAAALARERRMDVRRLVAQLAQAADDEDVVSRLVGQLDAQERAVVGFLASQEGTAVARDQIARITRIDRVDAILESLAARGLAQSTPSGWRFGSVLSPALAATLGTDSWAAAAIDEVTAWVVEQQGHPARIAAEQELILRTARQARRSKSWRQLQRLARGTSSAFLLSGLWETWATLLQAGLTAAQQLHDSSAAAWFLHQLGTRALCLGDVGIAGEQLRQALAIRRSLGEREGAAVTQHNLQLIPRLSPPWWGSGKVVGGGIAALLAVAGAGFGFAHATGPTNPPPIITSASPSASPSPTLSGVPELSPANLDFGWVGVGTSKTKQVMVSNRSLVPLPLDVVTVGADFDEEDRCPQSLEVRAICSIDVTFHPTAARTSHATLKLSYGSGKQRSVPLTGTGALPQLSLNPVSVNFKSQKVGRTSAGITVTLRNPGRIASTINQIRIDGDFGVDGACARGATQLSPGETCSLALTFKPSVKGDRRGQLLVQGDGVTASAQLSGVGVAPDPRFDPTTLDFGDQVVGVPGRKLLVAVKNAGDAPLEGAKTVVTDDFSASGCQQSVPPGAGCEISVTFAPRSRGAHAGTLRLIDDAGNVSGQVTLKGNALAPVVSLSPWPIDFTKTTAITIDVQVTNVGDAPLIIQTANIGGENRAYSKSADKCSGLVISRGQRCMISVSYVGAGSVQTTSSAAWLVLTDNAPGGTQLDPIYGPPMPNPPPKPIP